MSRERIRPGSEVNPAAAEAGVIRAIERDRLRCSTYTRRGPSCRTGGVQRLGFVVEDGFDVRPRHAREPFQEPVNRRPIAQVLNSAATGTHVLRNTQAPPRLSGERSTTIEWIQASVCGMNPDTVSS